MDLAYGHCHLQELKHSGLWSYFPWIWQTEKKRFGKRSAGERWVVFLEAATMVDPKALELLLAQYDAREPWYLGRSLQDDQMSIIHHYQQEPAYPLVHAGFALSGGLLKKLLKDLEEKPVGSGQQIEPVWELASRLGLLTQTGPETEIDRDPWECVIAVKTVDKFHPIRLPLLKEFWADESIVQVLYMSNTGSSAGAKIIDLSVDFGDMVDPKKESNKQGSGHCTKMQAILRYLHRFEPDRRWYVVTDDDTLVNVPRLLRVLDSHDDREAIYLGERYGWSHMQD
ncbi:unnamed protein product, partial [Durusdinium trenchii]